MAIGGDSQSVLQQRQNLQPGRLPCGQQSGKYAGSQRRNKRKDKQAPVSAGVGRGRKVAWSNHLAEQGSDGDGGYRADCAGGEGEQCALGEQLAQQTPARGAQSAAN